MIPRELQDGRYRTVLVDPPWPTAGKATGDRHRMAAMRSAPYQTLSAHQLAGMEIDCVAAEDAMLVLWATWMHLPLAMRLIETWGFRYCTGMPWLKVCKHDRTQPIYGPGVWFQHCTELVLLGRRGSPFGSLGNPRPARKGIIIHSRLEHSRKPEELHEWIEQKFPTPRIELFARRPRTGWTVWGNEIETTTGVSHVEPRP